MRGACFIGFLAGLATTGFITLHLRESESSHAQLPHFAEAEDVDVSAAYMKLLQGEEAYNVPKTPEPDSAIASAQEKMGVLMASVVGSPVPAPTTTIVLLEPIVAMPVPTLPPGQVLDEAAAAAAAAHAHAQTAVLPPHIVRL